jgi:acyl-coenzyme A thioesterase PaaI-like protein
LNFLLLRFIPFNRPHGLKVIYISDNEVKVKIPYWRINQNHLKGIHACCLATAAEYCSGFLLLQKLGMKNYRLIMESMEVSYKYQGKTAAIASFSIEEEDFQQNLLEPLKKDGLVYKKCVIKVHDEKMNLLCESQTNWQIKSWKQVKTKVN